MLNTQQSQHQQLYDKNPAGQYRYQTPLYTMLSINKHPENVLNISMEIRPRVQSRWINGVYFGKLIRTSGNYSYGKVENRKKGLKRGGLRVGGIGGVRRESKRIEEAGKDGSWDLSQCLFWSDLVKYLIPKGRVSISEASKVVRLFGSSGQMFPGGWWSY